MSMVPQCPAQTRVHIRWIIRRDMPEVRHRAPSFEYPCATRSSFASCVNAIALGWRRARRADRGLHDL